MPISLDGTLGPSAQSVMDEIKMLRGVTDIPIETHDERFTTVTAEQILLQQNVKRDKRRGLLIKSLPQLSCKVGLILLTNQRMQVWDSYMRWG
ncbi:MAG: hypothetical protein CM15mP49_09320 [Actinomycetota bacterium]|nr:MAG: hypothetical protein CM15mP49_09320 [Actinomycetota bacterium]